MRVRFGGRTLTWQHQHRSAEGPGDPVDGDGGVPPVL